VDGMRTASNDPLVRGIHEDAVPARILDEKRAVDEADDGMAAGDVRIRQHPVVVGETADGPSLDAEDLSARGPQCARLRSHDFQREDHRVFLRARVTHAGAVTPLLLWRQRGWL